MEPPTLLTVPLFAKSLGITPACIRRWIRERKVTTVKLGRLVRVPESEIARIVEAGTRPAVSDASRRGSHA